MAVYVDEAIWPFGRMMMCHMIADTREELFAMVDTIGVQRKWIQHKDTPGEHFDIFEGEARPGQQSRSSSGHGGAASRHYR